MLTEKFAPEQGNSPSRAKDPHPETMRCLPQDFDTDVEGIIMAKALRLFSYLCFGFALLGIIVSIPILLKIGAPQPGIAASQQTSYMLGRATGALIIPVLSYLFGKACLSQAKDLEEKART